MRPLRPLQRPKPGKPRKFHFRSPKIEFPGFPGFGFCRGRRSYPSFPWLFGFPWLILSKASPYKKGLFSDFSKVFVRSVGKGDLGSFGGIPWQKQINQGTERKRHINIIFLAGDTSGDRGVSRPGEVVCAILGTQGT